MAIIHRYWFELGAKAGQTPIVPPHNLRPARTYVAGETWVCVDVLAGDSLDQSFFRQTGRELSATNAVAYLEQTTAGTFEAAGIREGVVVPLSRAELSRTFPLDTWRAAPPDPTFYVDSLSRAAWVLSGLATVVTSLAVAGHTHALLIVSLGAQLVCFALILRRRSIVTRLGGALICTVLAATAGGAIARIFSWS